MSKEKQHEKSADFKLERYKYILQQLNSLNENVHKFLALYQALATAVIGGCVAIIVGWKGMSINVEAAKLGIRGLIGLLSILTIFIIFFLVSGVLSWYDYRREEVKLLDEVVGEGFRRPPNARNFWRWSETYLILFLIIIIIVIYSYIETKVIPKLQ